MLRGHWLALGQLQLDGTVEVLKLGIAVRVAAPFQDLAVRLETVAPLVKQFRHGLVAHRVAGALQLCRQSPDALAGLSQGRLRVTATGRLDQRFKVLPQGRIPFDCPRSTGAFAPYSPLEADITRPHICHAALHGRS